MDRQTYLNHKALLTNGWVNHLFRKGGAIGLFITLVPCPKYYNHVFLFVGSTTLGTFIEFWFFLLFIQTFQPLFVIYRRVNLCIIIEDLHQLIGHSLIPLDICHLLKCTYCINIKIKTRWFWIKTVYWIKVLIFCMNC